LLSVLFSAFLSPFMKHIFTLQAASRHASAPRAASAFVAIRPALPVIAAALLIMFSMVASMVALHAQPIKQSQSDGRFTKGAGANAGATDIPLMQPQNTQKQDLLWKKLEASIQAVDRGLEAAMGVAIMDLSDGRMLTLNADEIFPTASVIKLAVLAELYRQHEQGGQQLSAPYTVNAQDIIPGSEVLSGLTAGVTTLTNRDLAYAMTYASDDAATNILIDRVGLPSVNALLDRLGLRSTRLRRRMLDLGAAREGRENVATPRELVQLVAAMWRGQVVSKPLTDDMFKLISCKKVCYMDPKLPPSVVAATKPGWLEGMKAEAGIIFAENRPFAIAVMTSYAAEDAIATIAQIAHKHFERLGRSSQYGRVISTK
jgi:beta-lactamase class A